MDIFLKTTAGILVTVILSLTISKHTKDLSALLVLAVCCMVAVIAISQLKPVISFALKLQTICGLNEVFLEILLKAVGIGFLAELAELICTDSGNAALGKVLKLSASAIILLLALPLFENLIDLVENILVMI